MAPQVRRLPDGRRALRHGDGGERRGHGGGGGPRAAGAAPSLLYPITTSMVGHSLWAVLTRDGHCHTFGDPAYGQLGNGWTSASGISCYCAPTAVQLPAAVAAHVTEVACGDHHTLVRPATGDVGATSTFPQAR